MKIQSFNNHNYMPHNTSKEKQVSFGLKPTQILEGLERVNRTGRELAQSAVNTADRKPERIYGMTGSWERPDNFMAFNTRKPKRPRPARMSELNRALLGDLATALKRFEGELPNGEKVIYRLGDKNQKVPERLEWLHKIMNSNRFPDRPDNKVNPSVQGETLGNHVSTLLGKLFPKKENPGVKTNELELMG